jgi:mono/diheme cytochrome c family protein
MRIVLLLIAVSGSVFLAGTAAADGEAIYAQQCAACHGAIGEGTPHVGPPLKGAEFVKSTTNDDMIKVIREGRAGADKKHDAFPSVMPPFPQLSEDEIKAVAEYVRKNLQE